MCGSCCWQDSVACVCVCVCVRVCVLYWIMGVFCSAVLLVGSDSSSSSGYMPSFFLVHGRKKGATGYWQAKSDYMFGLSHTEVKMLWPGTKKRWSTCVPAHSEVRNGKVRGCSLDGWFPLLNTVSFLHTSWSSGDIMIYHSHHALNMVIFNDTVTEASVFTGLKDEVFTSHLKFRSVGS